MGLVAATSPRGSRPQSPPSPVRARPIRGAGMSDNDTMHEMLDVDEVLKRLGIKRTTLWRLESTGRFPPSRLIGKKKVWLGHELAEWQRNLPTTKITARRKASHDRA